MIINPHLIPNSFSIGMGIYRRGLANNGKNLRFHFDDPFKAFVNLSGYRLLTTLVDRLVFDG